MLAAFSLVVVLASFSCSAACFTECYCGQLGYYTSVVICNNLAWNQIPSNISRSLEAIDFSNNKLDHLRNQDFQGMSKLKSIELQYNNIRQLPVDIFSEAEELEIIDLSFNRVEMLPREVFKHNSRLEKLYLKQNPLSTPAGSMPLLSSDSLSVLDISFCGIINLREDSFDNLKNLKKLNIVGDNITSLRIDVVRPLRGLKRVETSGYEVDCKDASVRETMGYLRKNLVVIVPVELCLDEDQTEETETNIPGTTSNIFHAEEMTNDSQFSIEIEVKPTESNRIILESCIGTPRGIKELRGILPTDLVQAVSLLMAALILIIVAIGLVNLGRRNKRKQRQPLPPPDKWSYQASEPRSKVYTAFSGSLHEYESPVHRGVEEGHYSEVGVEADNGYVPPRETPLHASQWSLPAPQQGSAEPLLGRPVYRDTTIPVPDIIGHLRPGVQYVAHSIFAPPPRRHFWT